MVAGMRWTRGSADMAYKAAMGAESDERERILALIDKRLSEPGRVASSDLQVLRARIESGEQP